MTERGAGETLDTELVAVIELLTKVVPSILPPAEASGWPYHLVSGKPRDAPAPSHSTSAMIGYTLAALTGHLSRQDELAGPTLTQHDLALSTDDKMLAEGGYQCALSEIQALSSKVVATAPAASTNENTMSMLVQLQGFRTTLGASEDPKLRRARSAIDAAIESLSNEATPLTQSSLFGDDDPLTLDWIARLCVAEGIERGRFDSLLTEIRASTEVKIQTVKSAGPEDFRLGRQGTTSSHDDFVTHAWPVVRIGYLARVIKGINDLESLEKVLYQYFSQELAEQLGYADVRDSSFDVARLIFALDGVTLCKPTSLSAGLLARSLEIIVQSHAIDPRLQPRRPFKVTSTGGVHIPITVEVFQALVRVIRRLATGHTQYSALSRLLPVFRRYTAYLQASLVDVQVKEEQRELHGWASDHEYSSSSRIETWFTSQVTLYLLMYGDLLREHAAITQLQEVQLTTRVVDEVKDKFFQGDAVLANIARDFGLERLRANVTDRRSLLLYGPPGTGKTTIVEQVAAHVDWPILELSPSHFVDRGVDRVEERAAQLFRVLEHQKNIVVLFDEIDRLVLDRSSEEYGQQDDMFQFMTPSMLTKLNSLRRGARVIFAVATNYAWRIDSAILRPGRVDANYLILPPDRSARAERFAQSFGDLDSETSELLLTRTALASWSEVNGICQRLERESDTPNLPLTRETLSAFSPTIQLENYNRDLRQTDGEFRLNGKPAEYLFRELLGLYNLKAEVDSQFRVPSQHRKFVEYIRLLNGGGLVSSEDEEQLHLWLAEKR